MDFKKQKKLTLRTNFLAACAEASTLALRETSKDGLAKLNRDEVRMAAVRVALEMLRERVN